jgi:hypothetical protein
VYNYVNLHIPAAVWQALSKALILQTAIIQRR